MIGLQSKRVLILSAKPGAERDLRFHVPCARSHTEPIRQLMSRECQDNLPSKFPEETRRLVTQVLSGLGQLHWISVGFSVIAFVLERIDQVSSNLTECIKLLERMADLAKRLQTLNERMPDEREHINNAVHAIVEGAIICCCHMKYSHLSRSA
eukprot:Gb_03112 [translate_table: standard]